jgi:D-glycero-alpha-D-manno-heptose-7-phosphate kinase
MIMVRAPFRVSFVGGGSDLKDFYSRNGYGAVLSTTIDKYMYIMIHPYFHDKIRIKYSKTEDVDDIAKIQHPLVKECLKMVGIEKGIEIASIADVPAGTGVGSSSTFTVCLLHALYTYKEIFVTKERLAREACKIEIDLLKEPIGKQDQYASSYGGLNYIQFKKDETVFVESMVVQSDIRRSLKNSLLMFYVGNVRKASQVLYEQKKNMKQEEKYEIVKKMVKLTDEMKRSLNGGDIRNLGETLNEGWLLKKKLTCNISNSIIDSYYEEALKAGATGGKLLGAGGGGFLLFVCEPKYQDNIRNALNLKELRFKFDNEGSKIIFMDK